MTDRDDRMNQAFDLFKTPFYAWIGAGVRSFEILGDIGARVRAEEEARDGSDSSAKADATQAGDAADGASDATGADDAAKGRSGIADSMAERLRDARQRMFDLGDSAADQSRVAFLNALEAAQKSFNDALTKAQAGGDRAFASAHSLPDDVQSAADQLRPEHLRAVADGYLEAASKIYRELAARGEKAVDDGVSAARERGAAFDFPLGKEGKDGKDGADEDQAGLFGLLPFGGAAGAKLAESLEGMARDSVKPFQDAGNEFLGRLDQEKMSERVQSLLQQAADVTEQLLGALRAGDAATADAANVSADDIVDGEVIDDGSAAAAAADAKREEKDAKSGTDASDVEAKDIADADVAGAVTDVPAADAPTADAPKNAAPRKAAKKAAPRKAATKAAPRKAAKRTTAKKTAAPKKDSGTPTPADVKKTVEENQPDNKGGENQGGGN